MISKKGWFSELEILEIFGLASLKEYVNFAISADLRVKMKESKKVDKYLDFARELEKSGEHEGVGDNNCNLWTMNNPQEFGKETRGNIETIKTTLVGKIRK